MNGNNSRYHRFIETLILILAAVPLLTAAAEIRAEDWPGWRGPTGLGYTTERDLPLTWNGKSGENILWKAELHGGRKRNQEFASPGWSSPIVWGDRVFLTTAIWPENVPEKERRETIGEHHVLCYRATDGEPLWDTIVPSGKCVVNNFYHMYTVPTPVTDGKHVFALFASGVLVSLDFDGKIVWREELPLFKEVDGGICSSPILYKNTVIFPGIQELGLRALDKQTGKLKWEQATRQRNTYATPAVLRIGGKLQLIHIVGDYLYRISSNGVIRCWQVKDGELVYEKRAERITPSASLVATPNGRIYFASSGKTYVIQSGPEYKELAVNDLDDHPDYTSAAVSRGRIFIKGKSYLWCIGTK